MRLYELFTTHHLIDLFRYVDVHVVLDENADKKLQRDWWRPVSRGVPLTYEEFIDTTRHYMRSGEWRGFARQPDCWEWFSAGMMAVEESQKLIRRTANAFIAYELSTIDRHEHLNDRLQIEAGSQHAWRCPPVYLEECYSSEFYATLAGILQEKTLQSIAYPGAADFQTLKLCTEERWRRFGMKAPENPELLRVNILDLHGRWRGGSYDIDGERLISLDNRPGWFRGMCWYDEGPGPGELQIDDDKGGRHFYDWFDAHPRDYVKIVILTDSEARLHPAFAWAKARDGSFVVGVKKELYKDLGHLTSALEPCTS